MLAARNTTRFQECDNEQDARTVLMDATDPRICSPVFDIALGRGNCLMNIVNSIGTLSFKPAHLATDAE